MHKISKFRILDFRGGDSQEFFSVSNDTIANMNGMKVVHAQGKSTMTVGKRLIKQAENGKEYLLSVGQHAAIIRRTNDGKLQYLELQAPSDYIIGGWQKFEEHLGVTLRDRFGCTKKAYSGLEKTKVMFDLENCDLNTNEFKSLLGYLNTSVNEQQKGIGGDIK